MRSDDYGSWQESPRGRREPSRYDPDADYDSPVTGGDAQVWPDEQPWDTGSAGYQSPPPYNGEQPYAGRDWTAEQDPYGRTDPRGSAGYFGEQPHDPRGDYPSQPPVPRGDYPSQPPVPRGDYSSQPPVPRGDYSSQPPVPRGDYPSQPPVPRGDYPSQPPVPRGDYPSQPVGGYDGYAEDRYQRSYGDGQPYPRQPGYDGPAGYDSQEPYNGRPAFGEPDGFGGQDAFDGYGAGPNRGDNGYRQAPSGYGQDFDSYGAAPRSGPMPVYPAGGGHGVADEDYAAWQAQGGGIGGSHSRGGEYSGSARRDRRSAAHQQEEVGHDGPLGGSRRSGRTMDADDDRHSGFFAGYASNDDDHYGGRPARKRGRAAGMIALLIVLAMVGGAGFTAYHYYSKYEAAHASYTGSGYGWVDVTVPQGASGDSIGPELLRLGVIKAQDPWASYVRTQPSSLQPGEFRLHLHMGPAQAWAMLTNVKSRVNSTVTIIDGLRYSKILPLLAKESHLPLSQFQAAIKETAKLGLPTWAKGNPEGFLYPDTYSIVPGSTTALQILQMAVHEFNQQIASLNLPVAAQKAQFTELQVITEASLLEGEAGPKYYIDIARTLDNRLQINMPLQLDSTVSYATGDYRFNLSSAELHYPSPYNTFLHADLPPGPIDSPDIAAIKAVLHPAPPTSSNNWLYFITVNKHGLTYFTSSQSQFDTWVQLAQQNGL